MVCNASGKATEAKLLHPLNARALMFCTPFKIFTDTRPSSPYTARTSGVEIISPSHPSPSKFSPRKSPPSDDSGTHDSGT